MSSIFFQEIINRCVNSNFIIEKILGDLTIERPCKYCETGYRYEFCAIIKNGNICKLLFVNHFTGCLSYDDNTSYRTFDTLEELKTFLKEDDNPLYSDIAEMDYLSRIKNEAYFLSKEEITNLRSYLKELLYNC